MTHIEVLAKCRKTLTDEMGYEDYPEAIDAVAAIDALPTAIGQTSDGYHTFDELYEHRFELYIALCRNIPSTFVWRSKVHSDGTMFDGWFVLGMKVTPEYQITYHLPLSRWGECSFVSQTFETADEVPKFDGHTSADVLERLRKL